MNKKRRKRIFGRNNNTGGVNTKHGNVNLTRPSTNIDTIKTNGAIYTLIAHSHTDMMGVACIQETNNNSNDLVLQDGYGIYYSGNKAERQ